MPELPQQLLNSLKRNGDFNEAAFIKAHDEQNKITSVRLNPFKATDMAFSLFARVPWSRSGYYIAERPSFTLDPLFHAGCYYVQEAGSMFLEYLLRVCADFTTDLKILDLCAAPGGKSTLINGMMTTESLLVANELIKSRAGVLSYNLAKWGTKNTVVTNSEVIKFAALPGFFDIIVVDAPCSGSGLFRKQQEAIHEWSDAHVLACGNRQKKMLSEVYPALKQGGILVYSTCSYSVEENEDVVEWMISELGLELQKPAIEPSWKIAETTGGYRFYPHLTQSEGFFCAILKKTRTQNTIGERTSKAMPVTKEDLNRLSPFIPLTSGSVLKINEQFHFMNDAVTRFFTNYQKNFYFKKAGTVLGEMKRQNFVPNHELALSIYLSDSVHRIELSLEQALVFLKKGQMEALETTEGLALITYKSFGLGWVKVLKNRVNNYLPNELRILK
jgi:16S rRNA C967 or C1407 C5-methylase (RsmB/RsmF family)/NOL1/NOP2/fmu family ribosome biogenesis protein